MSAFPFRSTPVECLHTLLLGVYKYMFNELMQTLSPAQKNEVSAHIDCFPASGMDLKLSKNVPRLAEYNVIAPIEATCTNIHVGTTNLFMERTTRLWLSALCFFFGLPR